MAWTDIEKPKAGDLISVANYMGALKGNIEYLKQRNMSSYHHPGTGADYTVSGSLGVDIDGTNFNLSLTTYGGLVCACFFGQFAVSTLDSIRVNIVITDDVSYKGRNLYSSYSAEICTVDSANRGWIQFFPGLPAGTYNFKVVWGLSSAVHTGYLYVANKPFFAVWEQ